MYLAHWIGMVRQMEKRLGSNWVLLSPGLLIYLLFMVVPIGLCFYYSFFDWNGISPIYKFIGLANFMESIQDFQFHRAIGVTLFISFVATLFINVLGIFFAIMLNRQGKLKHFYRSVFFFPQLLSPVVIGFLWQSILNYNGIFNQLMKLLSLPPVEFLSSRNGAVLTITGVIIWQVMGFAIVLYLAALQTIPKDLYESVKIDGASKWQEFIHITFPFLAPSITINVVLLLTGSMREYDRVAVLTAGGPGGATETIAYRVVNEAFVSNRLGYSSSMAIYSLFLVAIIAIVLTIYLRKMEDRIL